MRRALALALLLLMLASAAEAADPAVDSLVSGYMALGGRPNRARD